MKSGTRSLERVRCGSSITAALTLILVMAFSGAAGADIVDVVKVDRDLVRISVGPGGHEQVSVDGFASHVVRGEPTLPLESRIYLIPEGMRVARVEVIDASAEVLPGEHPVLPGGYFEASMAGGVERLSPELIDSPDEFPKQMVSLVDQGWMRGYRVATVAVYPLRYRARGHQLVLYPEISYRLVLEPDPEQCSSRRLRVSEKGLEADRRFVSSSVENWSEGPVTGPEVVAGKSSSAFAPTEIPSLDGSLVEYLIITSDELVTAFEPLAEWKTKCGVPADIRTVSWIEDNYAGGADLQEKIRNFIRDAYRKWGVVYVLMGGDESIIPTRIARCDYYQSGGWDIPTELYYECLDGNWNGDGDEFYGEGYKSGADPGDWADLYPEVVLGRVPVLDADGVATFLDKLTAYQFPDSVGYQIRGLFMGEVVFPRWWDPGDPIYLNGKDCCQQGMQYLPSHWDTTTLFEYPDDTEDRDAVITAFQEGYAFTAYVGHGDAFKMSTADDQFIYVNDVDAFSNLGKYGIMFDLNCQMSQMEVDCINEHFIMDPDGGLIAPLGCTHFDFPHVGQFYLGEFCRLMFQTDRSRIGDINAAHKLPFMAQCSQDISAYRWSALTYILMGDPEMTVWTDLPDSMVVTHDGTIGVSGGDYLVTVTDGASPIEGAMVCFWKEEGGDYARGVTDAAGQVTLPLAPSSMGTASLVVTMQNFYPAVDSVTIGGGQARVFVSSIAIDDDAGGQSSGNGDGAWDAGETIEVTVTLKNGGDAAADTVLADVGLPSGSELTASLWVNGAADPSYIRIGRDALAPSSIPFTVNLSGDSLWGRPHVQACADTGIFIWEDAGGWHLSCEGGLGVHTFAGTLSTDGEILAVAPRGLETADNLTAGDSVFFSFGLDSTECWDAVDFVLTDSFFVDIVDTTQDYGQIDAGSSVARTFVVRAEGNAMDEHQARFLLDISDGSRGQWIDAFRLEVAAPVLEDHFHSMNDTTYGNGNGVPEIGDTVLVTCHILNSGSGTALGVQGTLRSISGAVVVDSTEVFGEVSAGELLRAYSAFAVHCTSSTPSVQLELGDGNGNVWREDWELIPASVPSGTLTRTEGPGKIILTWTGQADADLAGYTVYRYKESAGEVWERITDRVLEPVSYYEDSGLDAVVRYQYRLASVDTSGNESALTSMFRRWTNPSVQVGWPQSTSNQVYGSLLITDLEGDGGREVIVSSKDWQVWVWDALGNVRSGWPVTTGDEIWSSVAAVNLDTDYPLEILVGSNDTELYAWNADGTGYLNPSGLFATCPGIIRGAPVAADVDGDWQPEIFVGSGHFLMAFNHDGTGYVFSNGRFGDMISGETSCSPAIADVDDDTFAEIFIGSMGGNFYAWNHDGTGVLDSSGLFASTGMMWSSPAIGDIGNDGDLEIVAADMDGYVYAWNDTGGAVPGWPIATSVSIYSSPALGDLDGDNDLEIVVGADNGYVYAWHHDGTGVSSPDGKLTWTGGDVWSSPIIGDLDGDHDLEIVVGSASGELHALHHNGGKVAGFPIQVGEPLYSSPVIADLDRDGDIELAVGSYAGCVHIYDLADVINPAYVPWPMFKHDFNRTGFFDYVELTAIGEDLTGFGAAIRTALNQNYPNPCNPNTTISYSVASTGRVEVALFNVRGQRVTTLVDAARTPGAYTVEWDGTDHFGKVVSSGVYFCRMKACGGEFARKVVMLK